MEKVTELIGTSTFEDKEIEYKLALETEEGKTEKPSTGEEGEGGTSSEPATPTEEETTKS